MSTKEFVSILLPHAREIEAKHKIPCFFLIAQSAIESGWGKKAIGNNIFGIKANKSWNGKRVLVTTTEFHNTDNVKYPVIIKIEKTLNGKYKYTVKDYFRDYDTIADCLSDYVRFLLENKRYANAFKHTDPKQFAEEVAKAGYATDPNYANLLKNVIDMVARYVKEL